MSQIYSYRAKNSEGKIVSGEKEAENEREVALFLRQQGYYVLTIKGKTIENKDFSNFFANGHVNKKQLAVFCHQFSTMLKSGISVLTALQVLEEQSPNRALKDITNKVIKEIEAGQNLANSFKPHVRVFGRLFLSSLQVGETTGNLDNILEQLAVYYKKDYDTMTKIKTALSYPMMVLTMTSLILIFFLTVILPTFQSLFLQFKIELPLLTKLLLEISLIPPGYWLSLGILAVLLVYLSHLYSLTENGRIMIDQFKIRIPVFGLLGQKMSFVRFNMSLSLMLRSGIPLLQALDVAKETLGNLALAKEVDKLRLSVQSGNNIAFYLNQSAWFPLMMAKMVAVGEKSGSLEAMLNKVGEFYEEEVESTVQGLTILLEPFLILFLGLIVGTIMLSILLPMSTLISNVTHLGR